MMVGGGKCVYHGKEKEKAQAKWMMDVCGEGSMHTKMAQWSKEMNGEGVCVCVCVGEEGGGRGVN